jgi:hypothetical protein
MTLFTGCTYMCVLWTVCIYIKMYSIAETTKGKKCLLLDEYQFKQWEWCSHMWYDVKWEFVYFVECDISTFITWTSSSDEWRLIF